MQTDEDLLLFEFRKAVEGFNWEIYFPADSDFLELRARYSYIEAVYDRDVLSERITNKIRNILCGEKKGDRARAVFFRLHRALLFSIYIDKIKNELSANIAHHLFQIFTNEDNINELSPASLSEALACFRDYLCIHGTKVSASEVDHTNQRVLTVSKSVYYLKQKFGVFAKVSKGNVWIDIHEFRRVGKAITKDISEFGSYNFLEWMFWHLSKNNRFDEGFQRFHFPIFTTTCGDKFDPTIPWGYLFNLALKAPLTSYPNRDIYRDKLLNNVIETATALVSALDIEPYTMWDNMFKEGEDALKMMLDMSWLEGNFKIPQIRASDLNVLYEGLFQWTKAFEDNSFILTFETFKRFIFHFSRYLNKTGPVIIDLNVLRWNFRDLSYQQFSELIKLITHETSPNKEFESPTDFAQVDAFLKPAVKTVGNRIIVLPCASFSSYALIEAISAYYRERIDKFNDKMGVQIENFVKNQLDRIDIKYHSGKYKNSEAEEGEVDVAVEFEDLIGLFEIKKKSLTRKGRGGQIECLLIDLYQSFLDSQHQALGHEYSLLKDGCINFKNASSLKLEGRNVEKITIVLFDFGVIQDREVIRQILCMYLQLRFGVTENDLKESFSDLNKKCQKFCSRYEKYVHIRGEPENISFFGSWFLSIPQFLVLLDNVKTAADLKAALWNTKFIKYNTLDWYYEHRELLKFRERQIS